MFFYGGGFTKGARSLPPSHLVYNNLGAFFSTRGFITVIPDYRLVPHVKFPGGSEDVVVAINWTIQNLNAGDVQKIYVIGHSAGGVHVATVLLTPALYKTITGGSICGIIFIGTPFEVITGKEAFRKATEEYYGSMKVAVANQPLTLLRRATEANISGLAPILNMTAESEPRHIRSSVKIFDQLFGEKGGRRAGLAKLQGHDHLSPLLALSSGSGEEWGEYITKWIRKDGQDSRLESSEELIPTPAVSPVIPTSGLKDL